MSTLSKYVEEREAELVRLAKEYAAQSYLVSEENHPEEDEIKALEDLKSFHRQSLQGLVERLRGEMQDRANLLTNYGKRPSWLELEELSKHYLKKSGHKYHETAGYLLAIVDILQLLPPLEEPIIRDNKK